MLRLLRREEKNHLRSQLLDNNLIFKAFQAPVREYEIKHTKGYHMSPEEVFWSIVIKLDYIKEHQEDAMQDIMPRCQFGQNGISFMQFATDRRQDNGISSVFQKRTHAEAPHIERAGMPLSECFFYSPQEYGIAHFNHLC